MLASRNLKSALALAAVSATAVALPASSAAKSKGHVITAGTISGGYASLKSGWLTLRRAGSPSTALVAMINAANTLAAGDYPYVWGGGHGEAGIPSGGTAAENGTLTGAGFDCSGSVTAVLVAGGLWPLGASLGSDADVIAQLKKKKEIAAGAAKGANTVTLYDNPGVHIFMRIGSRYFGTSDGTKEGNKEGGPGWMTGKAYDVTSGYFKAYHILPALLSVVESQGLMSDIATTSTVQQKLLASELVSGEQLAVTYSLSTYGIATIARIAGANETTVTGTIASTTGNATTGVTSFTLTPAAGSASMQPLKLANYSGNTALTTTEQVTVGYMPVKVGTATVNQAWSVATPQSVSSGGSGL